MSNFQGVANTLFIPLEARIFVSRKFPEYFYDEKALSLATHITGKSIREKSSEYSFIASVARYYITDSVTKAFIVKHKHAISFILARDLKQPITGCAVRICKAYSFMKSICRR